MVMSQWGVRSDRERQRREQTSHSDTINGYIHGDRVTYMVTWLHTDAEESTQYNKHAHIATEKHTITSKLPSFKLAPPCDLSVSIVN